MKERLSVVMLAARGTVYKVILLMAMTGIVQMAAFYIWMVRWISPDALWLASIEIGMRDSLVVPMAGVSFVILCAILCLNGLGAGSKSVYTLRRLAISEKEVLCCMAVYNTLIFLLFWMSQALVMLGICRMYEWLAPAFCAQNGVPVSARLVGPQTVYIAFYRHKYLHSLLPMAEVSRWIRNLILVVSLGICTTTFPNSLRYGKKGIGILILVVLTLGMFCGTAGVIERDIVSGLIALAVGIASACFALGGAEDEAYI